MAIRSSRETINGRTYIVERDTETGTAIRYIPDPDASAKELLEEEMRRRATDLLVWHHMVEQAQARGESGPAIAELQALETQLYQRVRAIYVDWRVA